MNSQKQRAVGLLWWGLVIIGMTAAQAIMAPEARVTQFQRFVWFTLLLGSCGLLLTACGWAWLKRIKRASPEQSWWAFLHHDLIAMAIAAVLLAILVYLAAFHRELLKDLTDGAAKLLHELVAVRHFGR